jgi:PST family polysaccharide transporter
VLSVLTTAASVTILPRLIGPADFGVWAMAGVALGLMTIVRELGMVPAIAQAHHLTQEQKSGYFWVSVAVSLGSAAALALAAPVLARFYDAPLLPSVLWVCCFSLAISGFGLVHTALLRRELRYNRVALIEGGAILCALVATLVGAFSWRNVWALVAGHVASAIWMTATAVTLHRWLPGAPRPASARVDLSFSLQLTLYNVLTHLGNNVGLVAGYRFGATGLGFFSRAQQLYLLAHFSFLTPITEVAFSLLCRLKSEQAYRDAYDQLARRVWILFMPYAAVLPIVSGDLILALLGDAWAPAAPILAWFAPAVATQAFASLFAQLLSSQGRGGELRAWAFGDLLVRGGGAVTGSQFGLVGLAAGFSLASLLVSVPMMTWIAGRRGPVGLRHQLRAMCPGVLVAAAATLAAAVALSAAGALRMEAGWLRLALVGGSAALTWGLVCVLVAPAREALLGKGNGS